MDENRQILFLQSIEKYLVTNENSQSSSVTDRNEDDRTTGIIYSSVQRSNSITNSINEEKNFHYTSSFKISKNFLKKDLNIGVRKKNKIDSNEIIQLNKVKELEDELSNLNNLFSDEINQLKMQISEKDMKITEIELNLKEKEIENDILKEKLNDFNNISNEKSIDDKIINNEKNLIEEIRITYVNQIKEKIETINFLKDTIEKNNQEIEYLSAFEAENERLNNIIKENEKIREKLIEYDILLVNLNEKNFEIETLNKEKKNFIAHISNYQNELYEIKEQLRKSEFERKKLQFSNQDLEIKLKSVPKETNNKPVVPVNKKAITKKNTIYKLDDIRVDKFSKFEDNYSDEDHPTEDKLAKLEEELKESNDEKFNILNICQEQSERIFHLIEERSNLDKELEINKKQINELKEENNDLKKELKSFISVNEIKNKELLNQNAINSKLEKEIKELKSINIVKKSKFDSKNGLANINDSINSNEKQMTKSYSIFGTKESINIKKNNLNLLNLEKNLTSEKEPRHSEVILNTPLNKKVNFFSGFYSKKVDDYNKSNNSKFATSTKIFYPIKKQTEDEFKSDKDLNNILNSGCRRTSRILSKEEKGPLKIIQEEKENKSSLEESIKILEISVASLKSENKLLKAELEIYKKSLIEQKVKVDHEHDLISNSLFELANTFLGLKKQINEKEDSFSNSGSEID